MVYLIPAEQCMCWICSGGQPAPKGVCGGSACACKCHGLKGEEKKAFIDAKEKAYMEKIQAGVEKWFQENNPS